MHRQPELVDLGVPIGTTGGTAQGQVRSGHPRSINGIGSNSGCSAAADRLYHIYLTTEGRGDLSDNYINKSKLPQRPRFIRL